jgi:hypothetical protein
VGFENLCGGGEELGGRIYGGEDIQQMVNLKLAGLRALLGHSNSVEHASDLVVEGARFLAQETALGGD